MPAAGGGPAPAALPARARRLPTTRLAGVFAAAAVLALAGGALLSPAAAVAVGYALLAGAAALAWADRASAPAPRELGVGRAVGGPLRLGRASAVELAFVWRPRDGARRRLRPRPLWWSDGAPEALVDEAPSGEGRLEPGRPWRTRYAVRPRRRGRVRWWGCRLAVASRWGLWQAVVDAAVPEERTVYPGPAAATALPGRSDQAAAPAPGEGGTEFDGVRPYVPGDAARRLHWRATARRGEPVVRLLRPERGQRLAVVVDAGRRSAVAVGPGGSSRLDAFCAAALQVVAAAREAGDAVGLVLAGDGPPTVLPPRPAGAQLPAIASALALARPGELDPRPAAVAAAAMGTGADLVLWFTHAGAPEEVRDLARCLPRLCRRRPVAVLALRPAALGASAWGAEGGLGPPGAPDPQRAARREAAAELAAARARARRALAAAGAETVDAPAERLGAAAVRAYFRLGRRWAAG